MLRSSHAEFESAVSRDSDPDHTQNSCNTFFTRPFPIPTTEQVESQEREIVDKIVEQHGMGCGSDETSARITDRSQARKRCTPGCGAGGRVEVGGDGEGGAGVDDLDDVVEVAALVPHHRRPRVVPPHAVHHELVLHGPGFQSVVMDR